MAQPTIFVKDASGSSTQIYTINPNGQGTMANSQPVVLASDHSAVPIAPVGIGVFTLVPSGAVNGAVIGTPPSNAQGVRFLLPIGSSVTYVRATVQPSAAPSLTWTISNAISGPTYDEPLAGGVNVYVTSTVGTPIYFWL